VVLKPLADRVVVKPIQAEEKTKGGIVLPDTAKDKPQEGEVIAVGTGRILDNEGEVIAVGTGRILDNGTKLPLEVKVGDRVVYSKYSGSEIKIDGEEYLIIRESDVLAIRQKD